MNKITIKHQTKGIGILTRGDDGKYSIELNGKKAASSACYDLPAVQRIIDKARAEGSEITIEE